MKAVKEQIFIVIHTYKLPFEELREHLPEHQRFIAEAYRNDVFIVSGGMASRTGGVFVIHGLNYQQVDILMQQDPFVKKGLVDFEIIEINASRACDELGLRFVSTP